MKIAVTSQNFRTVTGHAGRARRFLIYDTEPGTEPAEALRLDLPKELAMHDFHGAGPHPVDGVDVILSQSFGDGFARRMAKRGIVAVATDKTDPMVAVKEFLARPQTEPEAPTAAMPPHGHGHAHRHAPPIAISTPTPPKLPGQDRDSRAAAAAVERSHE